MIVKRKDLHEVNHRTDYRIQEFQDLLGHLVMRRTTPINPFINKPHAGDRYWFILEGQGTVMVGEEKADVEPGDLIYVPEWTENSLTSDSEVRWICFG
ncbi:MAG: cupin domain-containing protein [Chloroflexi bacterium]|nr:cupin domain-containing protein [Chloroflexota bacterium]